MTTYFDAINTPQLLSDFPMGATFVTTGTADYPSLLPVCREFLKNKLGLMAQVELVEHVHP